MPRLFVAIELPGAVKERLSLLCGGVPGARWLSTDQMHLTLKFIGEVDGARFDDIRAALEQVRGAPCALSISGVGLYGKLRQPRVLWAGIEPEEEVIWLHGAIEKSLSGLGVAPDKRKYRPHVTLARFKNGRGRRIRQFLEQNGALTIPGIDVTRFVLFSSFLSHSGAIYSVEETYSL